MIAHIYSNSMNNRNMRKSVWERECDR